MKKGQKVRIVGPWSNSGNGGDKYIGSTASILLDDRDMHAYNMCIEIKIDGWDIALWWCRENLRLIRKARG